MTCIFKGTPIVMDNCMQLEMASGVKDLLRECESDKSLG